MRRHFIVTIDTETPVGKRDLCKHIRDAVGHWGGSFEPEDQLHPNNIRRVTATCAPDDCVPLYFRKKDIERG